LGGQKILTTLLYMMV